jgi:hypothetical protein
MMKDLTSSQLLLEEYMSEISERCYSAGWMENLEYVLWHALINGQRKYGQSVISQKDIQTLIELSNSCNAWIIFDDETEETAMHLDA